MQVEPLKMLGLMVVSLVLMRSPMAAQVGAVPAPLAVENLAGMQLSLMPTVPYETARVTIRGPGGYERRKSFEGSGPIAIDLAATVQGVLPDGKYRYEVRFVTGKGRETKAQPGTFFVVGGSALARSTTRAQLDALRQELLSSPKGGAPTSPAGKDLFVDGRVSIRDSPYDGLTELRMGSAQIVTAVDEEDLDGLSGAGSGINGALATNWVHLQNDLGDLTIGFAPGYFDPLAEQARMTFLNNNYGEPYFGINTSVPSGSLEVASAAFPELVLNNSFTGDQVRFVHTDTALAVVINGTTSFVIEDDAAAESFRLAKNNIILNGDVQVPNGEVTTEGLRLASSRTLKERVAVIDPAQILERLRNVPVSEWSFRDDEDNVRHIGPMAEDFHEAFALEGQEHDHLSVTDVQGVAIAAIQGLDQSLERQMAALREENAELRRRLEALERAILEH